MRGGGENGGKRRNNGCGAAFSPYYPAANVSW